MAALPFGKAHLNHISNFNPTHVIELDISGCFDNISHRYLLNNIPINKHILKSWLKQGFINADKTFGEGIKATTVGIPQGGILSPTLCNMTLDGIDEFVRNKLKEEIAIKKLTPKELGYVRLREDSKLITIIRYADDMVIQCKSKILAQLTLPIVKLFLAERGLTVNEAKTKRTDVAHNGAFYDFVGYRIINVSYPKLNVNKWLIIPPPSNEEKLRIKVKTICRSAKNPRSLFLNLNEVVRGWINFYRPCNARKSFNSLSWWLSAKVYRTLFRLSSRLSGNRSKRNVKLKQTYTYLMRRFSRFSKTYSSCIKWWGMTDYTTTNKRRRRILLVCPVNTRLLRGKPMHISGVNFYHPEDREKLMNVCLNYKTSLRKQVIKRDNYQCRSCGLFLIDASVKVEIHHVLPVSKGGNTTPNNLITVCYPCHKEIHATLQSNEQAKLLKLIEEGLLDIKLTEDSKESGLLNIVEEPCRGESRTHGSGPSRREGEADSRQNDGIRRTLGQ